MNRLRDRIDKRMDVGYGCHMTTNTTTTTFGVTQHGGVGCDFMRGISEQEGVYTALSNTFSRDFKSLRGAVAFMAARGFDAHGNRI